MNKIENKIERKPELATPKVTTGPLPASQKIYDAPDGHPDVCVPFREIALSEGEVLSETSGKPAFRVYDPSGPYTDVSADIDVARGLPRVREAWVKERGFEAYDGRAVKPEDNGNAAGAHRARDFPNKPRPYRGLAGKPVTQLEYARAGVITKEMIYVAHRENLGRRQALERAKAALKDGESFGADDPRAHHARVRAL